MADINSTTITNLNASPVTLPNARNSHGRLRVKTESVDVAIADNDGDVLRFFRVRSSDSIKSLEILTHGTVGFTDGDVGLYDINGGAVVDANLYAEQITLADPAPTVTPLAATGSGIECRFGVAAMTPDKINQQVWEDLGLSADPNKEYDVCILANTIGAAVGLIAMRMYYTSGD